MTNVDDQRVITIHMNGHDFELLCNQTCAWEGRGWDKCDDTFEVVPYDRDGEPVSYGWLYAHWFDRWGDVILARSFLTARGEGYQILSDESEDGGFIIVTNYYGPRKDGHLRPDKEETK